MMLSCPLGLKAQSDKTVKDDAHLRALQLSVRAQLGHSRTRVRPADKDVIWTREMYHVLELSHDPNGVLYNPVRPQDGRINLFTTLINLLAENRIPAYEFVRDGNERLTNEYMIKLQSVLDQFHIPYQKQQISGLRDSVVVVDNKDIPSSRIRSYLVKEMRYFDFRTSNYGSVITAISPVYHQADPERGETVKIPMFWVEYTDLIPYLSRMDAVSNSHRVTPNSSLDDFFSEKMFAGEVYKTANLQDRLLEDYPQSDAALVEEKKRIEAEVRQLEQSLKEEEKVVPEKVIITEVDPVIPDAEEENNSRAYKKRQESGTGTDAVAPAKASTRRQRK